MTQDNTRNMHTDERYARYIDDLNTALSWEYSAVVQYVQHATVMTGAEYDAITKELAVHANEELAHALSVAQLISDLGATPTVEVAPREVSTDVRTMLQQDLEGEEKAIAIYKRLIAAAEELQEFGQRRILEDILMQEEEHRRDLLQALGQ